MTDPHVCPFCGRLDPAAEDAAQHQATCPKDPVRIRQRIELDFAMAFEDLRTAEMALKGVRLRLEAAEKAALPPP